MKILINNDEMCIHLFEVTTKKYFLDDNNAFKETLSTEPMVKKRVAPKKEDYSKNSKNHSYATKLCNAGVRNRNLNVSGNHILHSRMLIEVKGGYIE